MAFEHILAFSTPLGVAFTDVFACCLKEVLNEYSYYADCAGLQYDVRVSKGGFELMFYGYHHKLPVLVQKVLLYAVMPSMLCCFLGVSSCCFVPLVCTHYCRTVFCMNVTYHLTLLISIYSPSP